MKREKLEYEIITGEDLRYQREVSDFKGENLRPVSGIWPYTYNILIDNIYRKVREIVFNPAITQKTIHVTQILWERV